MTKKKILAVIQARGGSKGIPKKNIYPINGHPLISYTIAAALKTNLIDDLIVSSDSREIRKVAIKYGAKAPFRRPKKLAGDKVLSVDSLIHATLKAESIYKKQYDYVIELPCVSPLRDHRDIDNCINLMINNNSDSVISMVDTGEKHPVRLKKIINNEIKDFCKEYPEPGQNSRRQDLSPKSFIRNGAIYLVKRKILLENQSRHGEKSTPYIMSSEKSVNIDNYEDLRLAEYKIINNKCNNNPNELLKADIKIFKRKNKKKILITTNLSFARDILESFKKNYDCVYAPGADRLTTIKLLEDIDIWLCSPSPKYRIDGSLIKNFQKLKLIVTPSTGSNHIDKIFCNKNKIKVIALKDTSFVNQIFASSEFAFALILATVRKLPQSYNSALTGKWREEENKFRSIELRDKKIGIIGFGRIGQNVAKYSKALGMNVIYFDPYKEVKNKNYKKIKNVNALLAISDIVLIAVHLDKTTKNMFTKKLFNKMKDGSYFINISRGEIINESDLIKAMKSGKIVAAGVDVLSDEQTIDISTNLLMKYAKLNNNLIITPHIAGLTVDSEKKAATFAFNQIKKFN
tara:strand:+ start:12496 stop:14217 length:1722 start_codon:yes stop_codon:yes gene_type:complete